MSRRRTYLLISLTVVAIAIAIADYIALERSLFWTHRWLDIPMHFFGGFFIGLFAIMLQESFRGARYFGNVGQLTLAVVAGLCVGTAWEVYEYVIGVFLTDEFFPDTLYDLLMDTLGALAAYPYVRFVIRSGTNVLNA